jgi:hypothetical protein
MAVKQRKMPASAKGQAGLPVECANGGIEVANYLPDNFDSAGLVARFRGPNRQIAFKSSIPPGIAFWWRARPAPSLCPALTVRPTTRIASAATAGSWSVGAGG